MFAPLLLLTDVTSRPGAMPVLAATWAAPPSLAPVFKRVLYIAPDAGSALEIVALPDMDSLSDLRPSWQWARENLGPHLASDFRRQVLEFVDAPMGRAELVPTTPWLQLHHVECPPAAFDGCVAWCERTFHDLVRDASKVDVVVVYHAVLSTQPGVMILVGSASDVEKCDGVLSSPRGRRIVREGGSATRRGKGADAKVYRRFAD